MSQTLREWADAIRTNTPPPQVDEKHVPTANERNNVVYLSMKMLCHGMRQADLAVVESMASGVKDMADLHDRYCVVLGEYLWDHWMGEPDEISQEDVVYACQTIKDQLFSMDETTRNSV